MSEAEKTIASNPQARHDYFLLELVEAGLVLTGTEIKSLRNQTPSLKDSFVEVRGANKSGRQILEGWILHFHIPPYSHGNIYNHDPVRPRKLLLHKHQLDKMHGAIIKEGTSVIPTRLYFKNGRAKIELALAKGKKKHDKRASLKQKSADKEIAAALKKHR